MLNSKNVPVYFIEKTFKQYKEFLDKNPRYKEKKISSKLYFEIIQNRIKSFKQAPNGMQWTKEEKQKFEKLSTTDMKKYLIQKMGFKTTLLKHLNLESEYIYKKTTNQTALNQFDKAMKLLSSLDDINDFSKLKQDTKDQIISSLRIAYNHADERAGAHLAECLFLNNKLDKNPNSKEQMIECANIYKAMCDKKIPDGYYGYYSLYVWSVDNDRLFNANITPGVLGLNKESAIEYFNLALESGVWGAIEDVANRVPRTALAGELWISAGIVYQSASAFSQAAFHFSGYGVHPKADSNTFSIACLRMAIMLGSVGALKELAFRYENGKNVNKSQATSDLLIAYMLKRRQKELINGLDPYFDEKFPPEPIIDFGGTIPDVYGGTMYTPGLMYLRRKGFIKDPRDKDASFDDIKHFYLTMWDVIVHNSNFIKDKEWTFLSGYIPEMLYDAYPQGFPSARMYVFPKEILDLKIDFTKGLEPELKTMYEKNNND